VENKGFEGLGTKNGSYWMHACMEVLQTMTKKEKKKKEKT